MLDKIRQKYSKELKRLEELIRHIDNFEKLINAKIILETPTQDKVYKLLLEAKKEIPKKIERNEIYEQTDYMVPEILELIESMENRKMKEETYNFFKDKNLQGFIEYLENKFRLHF